jgi:hypothetical protein
VIIGLPPHPMLTATTRAACVADAQQLARTGMTMLDKKEITFRDMVLTARHNNDVVKMNNSTNSAIRKAVHNLSVASAKLAAAAKAKHDQELSDEKAAKELEREENSATETGQVIASIRAGGDRVAMLDKSRDEHTADFGNPAVGDIQQDLQNLQPGNHPVPIKLSVAAAAGSTATGI